METVRWQRQGEDMLPGKLRIIDQTRLPEEKVYIETDELQEVYNAIQRLSVRGAPAIGCAAALGLLASCQHSTATVATDFSDEVESTARYLKSARPTAVNLAWAVDRCTATVKARIQEGKDDVAQLKQALAQEALDILHEDMELGRRIGETGVQLFGSTSGLGVLTHCNAGALATSRYGTALAPIYLAHEKGLSPRVFADETRPLLQGARLTAWELAEAGVDVTVMCDNMAAQVMKESRVDMVIVGTDRIAANGDVANKIGTYGVAVLCQYHNIPFYVAAPYSTIDLNTPTGEEIPIEQRDPNEIRRIAGKAFVTDNASVYNPAFDVTPAELVTAIITERGILEPPFEETLQNLAATESK